MSFASDVYERAQLDLQRQWELVSNCQRTQSVSPTEFNISGSATSISTLNLLPNQRILTLWDNLLHQPNTTVKSNNILSLQQIKFKLENLQNDTQLNTNDIDDNLEIEEELEWLLIGQLTIASYTQLVDILLNSSNKSTQQLNYWNSIKFSNFRLINYWIQTLPKRCYKLIERTYKLIRQDPSLLNLEYGKLIQVLKTEVLSVPTKVPYFTKLGVYLPTNYFATLRLEVNNKINHLDRIQLGWSCLLGGISEFDLNFCHRNSLTQSVINPKKLIEFLSLLETWFDSYERFQLKKSINSNDFSFESTDSEWNLNQQKLQSTNPLDSNGLKLKAYTKLKNIIDRCLYIKEENSRALKKTQLPNRFERYYFPVLIGYFLFNRTFSTFKFYQNDIVQWMDSAAETGKRFFMDWILQPLQQMYRTIRHKEHRLQLMSTKSLDTDLDSLERMIKQFVAKHGNGEVDSNLVEMVQLGDLTPLLKVYEQDIQNPIKSALFGNLIQELLIQLQKTKVDLGLAMSALDKLLQSNELNFGMLAVMPSLLLTYGFINYLTNRWSSRNGSSKNQIKSQLRKELRNIHKILNISMSNDPNSKQSSHPKYKGKLLIHLNELRGLSNKLTIRGKLGLLEDVRELESNQLSIHQKLNVWTRCYNDQLLFNQK